MPRRTHIALRGLPGGRPFTLLLAGLAVSGCGDWLYNVALLAFVYARTGSASWVAATTAARVLPVVVFGPLGGLLADRHDRRRLLIASDLVRAGLMVGLAAVAAAGLPAVLAPVLAAAATTAAVVHPPSVAASTARLVPEADLQRASALRAAVGQAAVVVGPALGALVLAVSDPATAILLNAVTFLVSAATTLAIAAGPAFAPAFAPAERRSDAPAPRLLSDLAAGARALRGAPVAVRLVVADLLCSAVYGLLTVILVLASHRIGAGAGGYGLLLGAFGIGGLIGAALTARLAATAVWRRALLLALGLVGLPLAALGLAPSLATALPLALLAGGGMIVAEVLSETALPRLLADDVLARAYGLVFPASIAGIVIGSVLAGPLVSALGLTGAFVAAGSFVLAAGAFLLHRPLEVRIAAAAPAV